LPQPCPLREKREERPGEIRAFLSRRKIMKLNLRIPMPNKRQLEKELRAMMDDMKTAQGETRKMQATMNKTAQKARALPKSETVK
jgi:hypothetical protein